MIKLSIKAQAKTSKYIELSQSLYSMQTNLEKLCSSLIISEENKVFYIIAKLNSTNCLDNILNSKEIKILSGTLKILSKHTEISIQGLKQQLISNDISGIQSQYSLINKTEILK